MKLRHVMLGLISFAVAQAAAAQPLALSSIHGDNAVIQRDHPIALRGIGLAGSTISATLGERTGSAIVGSDGRWSLSLPALSAGGPFDLIVSDNQGNQVAKRNILIGDVWLCSGQSNMELTVTRALDVDSQLSSASDDGLRLVTIPKSTPLTPQQDFAEPAQWKAATRESVAPFSAACYYMVRELRASQKVPIGAINASWGGTQIRAWLDPAAIKQIYGAGEATMLAKFSTDPLAANVDFAPQWMNWWRKSSGDTPGNEPWIKPDSLQWTAMPSLEYWDNWAGSSFKTFNGWVWARYSIDLTAEQAKQGATLSLGVIDDSDQTFVNGKPVANSFGWSLDRNYAVPSNYWKAGRNEIMIAIGDSWGNGGFAGPASKFALTLKGGQSISLGEGWRYSISPVKGSAPRPPWDSAAGLGLIYNGMVAPLGPIGLKGVAWYQGESDVNIANYRDRLAAWIAGWRKQFGKPDLPALVVGLANFGPAASRPVESGWAVLREEQRQAALNDKAMALVPAVDLGERLDIHPANKIELGRRLAQAATVLAYRKSAPLPPAPIAAKRDGNDILVQFANVNGNLESWSSAQAIGFELCSDGASPCRFAQAVPEGSAVRISGDGKPVTRIRYGWSDTAIINLYDRSPLPVGPFEIAVP